MVIILPHTTETEKLVDAEFLRRMPDGALLVNLDSGKIVNHEDLIAELNTERLHAALDVVNPERLPPESHLWKAQNPLIASHVAGNTMAFIRDCKSTYCRASGRLGRSRHIKLEEMNVVRTMDGAVRSIDDSLIGVR